MQTLPSPPLLTIIPPDKIPDWLAGSPSRHLQQIVQFALVSAGVSGQARLRFLCEMDVLKKKNLPSSSLVLQNSSRYYGIDTVTLIVTGKDARNHKVRATLTMDSAQCEKFAQYITDLPAHTFVLPNAPVHNPVLPPNLPLPAAVSTTDTPVCRPALPPNRYIAEFDDDSLAIYLSSLQENGSTFTKSTADAIAMRTTGSTEIFYEAFTKDLISYNTPGILKLTTIGHALLKRLETPAVDATKPSPSESGSEFTRLKSSLIEARRQHQAAKDQHDARAQALTALTHQLTEAREALKSEELHITTLLSRLQKLQQDLDTAQSKATTARSHVLALEEQARTLDTSSPDLIQAERTLQEAETAYQQLIAL